ncbi:hypothetical protein KP509_27G042800 [Ceratopteris richardii]|uniref:Uncharacterized protein n=1 Tax=Ceratopteris richardii TaxID=49495 RepID=A0A8T2RFS1_CERRI|nr:hypothetical protein KP509_27G042800 [Ceratopteris richardii]
MNFCKSTQYDTYADPAVYDEDHLESLYGLHNHLDHTGARGATTLSYQQSDDFETFDDKNILANIIESNRQSMLWNQGILKKNTSMFSSQEEDFLSKNSMLLASFEVPEHCVRRSAKGIQPLAEDCCSEDTAEEIDVSTLSDSRTFSKNDEHVRNFGGVNSVDTSENSVDKSKEATHSNGMSSWSSHNSEEIDYQSHSEDLLDGFDAVMMRKYVKSKGEHPHGKNTGKMLMKNVASVSRLSGPAESVRSSACVPQRADEKRSSNRSEDLERTDAVPQEVSSNVPLVKPVGSAQLKDRMMLHVDDDTTTIESLEEKNVVHKALKKSSVTKENPEFEALQHEVFELRKENGNFRKLLKTQRLKKERAKLEKQAKLLAQLPSKKERNEIEDLKSKIASLISEQAKKSSLQNLTINRLRRTIADLTEEKDALKEEVKRYERFLHSEFDGNTYNRRKTTAPKLLATENSESVRRT